jgi:hypothetical protein
MGLLFWISALTIGYVYVGYPALLVVWARLKARHLGPAIADRTPRNPRALTARAAIRLPQSALASRLHHCRRAQ